MNSKKVCDSCHKARDYFMTVFCVKCLQKLCTKCKQEPKSEPFRTNNDAYDFSMCSGCNVGTEIEADSSDDDISNTEYDSDDILEPIQLNSSNLAVDADASNPDVIDQVSIVMLSYLNCY